MAPCPQRRHAQALRGFGHGAPAAQGLNRKAGQPRQHPSTAGPLSGWSMGVPGSLYGLHVCDSNPSTHNIQVALGGPRRFHPSLLWHVNRQGGGKASGQKPSRRNQDEPRPDTHLRASCTTPRSPQLPPHPFLSFCRCASLAPAACQPGPCPARLAPAACWPGPCPAHQAPALPIWPLLPASLALALPAWPLLSACLAFVLPTRPLPCPPGPCFLPGAFWGSDSWRAWLPPQP